MPENAQTQVRKIVDSGTRRSRVGYLAFNEERNREDGNARTIHTISIQQYTIKYNVYMTALEIRDHIFS